MEFNRSLPLNAALTPINAAIFTGARSSYAIGRDVGASRMTTSARARSVFRPKPIPAALVRKLVKARIAENMSRCRFEASPNDYLVDATIQPTDDGLETMKTIESTDEGETFGLSVFLRDGNEIYHTCFANGAWRRASRQRLDLPRPDTLWAAGGFGGFTQRLAANAAVHWVALQRQLLT
jgi:hypothetical protein